MGSNSRYKKNHSRKRKFKGNQHNVSQEETANTGDRPIPPTSCLEVEGTPVDAISGEGNAETSTQSSSAAAETPKTANPTGAFASARKFNSLYSTCRSKISFI